MLKQVREKDLNLFVGLTKTEAPKDAMELPVQVIIPAFMISELRRAFEIGFMLFLPFLIIDLVTASILMSMGMDDADAGDDLPALRIIFFVLVDGWYSDYRSLIQSFDDPAGYAGINYCAAGGVVGGAAAACCGRCRWCGADSAR